MSTPNFSDLIVLWPFANRLNETLFVYKQHQTSSGHNVPPNDEMAKLAISTALGTITLDDSKPGFHLVGYQDDEFTKIKCKKHHLIYIGGGVENDIVQNFLNTLKSESVKHVCKLPETQDRPRIMPIEGFEPLQTDYYDVERKKVKEDYGLILLTNNPFAADTSLKALLVAGAHSYGTYAAALAISGSELSKEIADRIMAYYHLPPHMLGTLEVVVKTTVDKDGETLNKVALSHIFVDGKCIFLADEKKVPVPRKIDKATGSLKIKSQYNIDDSAIATPNRELSDKCILDDEFFKRLSDSLVIVISPHSDDSVLGCGGLIYYLRNKKLWKKKEKECPSVYVLVMTASPRGVEEDYIEDYYTWIGHPHTSRGNINSRKSEIRNNESIAESEILGSESSWLELNVDDKKDCEKQIEEKLNEIIGEEKKRSSKKSKLLILIPHPRDEHPTHRTITELMMKIIREDRNFKNADVWLYESPWIDLDNTEVNVLLPLDKHAMFAKCQAMAMHRSQESRTRYTDVARGKSRYRAEVLPELLFGHGTSGESWDYVEAFQWKQPERLNFMVKKKRRQRE